MARAFVVCGTGFASAVIGVWHWLCQCCYRWRATTVPCCTFFHAVASWPWRAFYRMGITGKASGTPPIACRSKCNRSGVCGITSAQIPRSVIANLKFSEFSPHLSFAFAIHAVLNRLRKLDTNPPAIFGRMLLELQNSGMITGFGPHQRCFHGQKRSTACIGNSEIFAAIRIHAFDF